MNQPLLLTLQLAPTAQAVYEDLRRRYFPAERNLIPARDHSLVARANGIGGFQLLGGFDEEVAVLSR